MITIFALQLTTKAVGNWVITAKNKMITIQEVAQNLNLEVSDGLVVEMFKILVIENAGIYQKKGNWFFTKDDIIIMNGNPPISFGNFESDEDLKKNKLLFSAAFSRKVDLETAFNNSLK